MRSRLGQSFSQGGDRRVLDERIGRDEIVLLQYLQRADVLGGDDEIADPPARHGEILGKTVDDETILRKMKGRVFRILVAESVVYLVRNDGLSQFGERRHIPA